MNEVLDPEKDVVDQNGIREVPMNSQQKLLKRYIDKGYSVGVLKPVLYLSPEGPTYSTRVEEVLKSVLLITKGTEPLLRYSPAAEEMAASDDCAILTEGLHLGFPCHPKGSCVVEIPLLSIPDVDGSVPLSLSRGSWLTK